MPSIFSLDVNDYKEIDNRLKPFLTDWSVKEIYKDKTVNFPGTWNSDIFPVKYFQVIKGNNDPNFDPEGSEDEIGLTLWAGWKENDNSGCYDHEVEFNLFIIGKDVKDSTNYKVGAEILKAGGAHMEVFYKGKLVTDFTKIEQRRVFWYEEKIKISSDKIWISDMRKFL